MSRVILCIVAMLLISSACAQTNAPTNGTNATNVTSTNVTSTNVTVANTTNPSQANGTTSVPVTTNTTTNSSTAAPSNSTAAPNSTVAPNNSTNGTTVSPNATNANGTNVTTAPAGTNASTAAPVTPAPTTQLPSVSITVQGTLATFNETLFKQLAAAVVGLNASNIEIISKRESSVNVNFRFVGVSPTTATTAASEFVQVVQSNTQFKNAFPVLSTNVVTYPTTPAPKSASSKVAVCFALLFAVVAFFAH